MYHPGELTPYHWRPRLRRHHDFLCNLLDLHTAAIRSPLTVAPELRATPCLVRWLLLDELSAYDTCPAVRRRISPVLAQHSLKPCASSPVLRVHGSGPGCSWA